MPALENKCLVSIKSLTCFKGCNLGTGKEINSWASFGGNNNYGISFKKGPLCFYTKSFMISNKVKGMFKESKIIVVVMQVRYGKPIPA